MTYLNLDTLLNEISPQQPAGEDLEYDSSYTELERLSASRPEQSIGDSEAESEPRDWGAIRSVSLQLFSRTKDLRVAVLLTRSLTNLYGYQGLSEGLSLISGLLHNYWDTLYPLLDVEDDNDPTMRMNTLVSLCDKTAMLDVISRASLASVKGLGSFSLRDIQKAHGEVNSDEGEQQTSMASIQAAFLECPLEELQSISESIATSQSNITTIDEFLMAQVGSSFAPDLDTLVKKLKEANVVVTDYLKRRGAGPQTSTQSEEPGAGTVSAAATRLSGEIHSRDDATRMMDKISEYFRNNEPSSPVPMLMERAKRLSTMDFMAIVKDIAPDGLVQAQNIGGIAPESEY